MYVTRFIVNLQRRLSFQDGVKWHDIACYHTKPYLCEDSELLLDYVESTNPELDLSIPLDDGHGEDDDEDGPIPDRPRPFRPGQQGRPGRGRPEGQSPTRTNAF